MKTPDVNVNTCVTKEETWDLRCFSIPSDNLKQLSNAFLYPRTFLNIVFGLDHYWELHKPIS